jgi:hypothetical protein
MLIAYSDFKELKKKRGKKTTTGYKCIDLWVLCSIFYTKVPLHNTVSIITLRLKRKSLGHTKAIIEFPGDSHGEGPSLKVQGGPSATCIKEDH